MRTIRGFAWTLVVLLGSGGASAEATGATATGVVVDGGGLPLPGASIVVDKTLRAATDRAGRFTLGGLAAGGHEIVASYVGYESVRVGFSIEAGEHRRLEPLVLGLATFRDVVEVRAEPFVEGEARALTQQRNALGIRQVVDSDQLGRLPDHNAAEALQRLGGVTVTRDQGDARQVAVRGTPPQWSSVMLDGERIPSGEADQRSVALDILPLELLERIEVDKVLTPDMDGDAIGGTVDLVTRLAPPTPRLGVALGVGRDDLSDGDRAQGSVTAARRFGDGRLGVLVSASRADADRGVESLEAEYDEGEPSVVRYQSFEVERSRAGALAALDLDGERGGFVVRGLWSEFEDQELRRRVEHQPPEETVARELKDRFETQEILSLGANGHTVLGGSALLEMGLAWNRAEEEEPFRQDTIFTAEEVGVEPGGLLPAPWDAGALESEADAFELAEVLLEQDAASTEDLVGRLDLTLPLGRVAGGSWKLGAKLRAKRIERDENIVVFEAEDAIALTEVLSAWTPASPFFDGRFELGPFPDPAGARDLVDRFGLEGEKDAESDLGDYRADEDTVAAYGMVDLPLGTVSVVGGLRWEGTETDYTAQEIVIDEEGELVGLVPTSGGGSYDELLPMVALRWAATEADVVRGGVSRSLARPNLEHLAPFRLQLDDEGEILLGNPGLEPTLAWNLDLAWSRRLEPLGLLSVGLYYKDLEDVIALTRSELDDGETTVFTPTNAGDGELVGLELGLRNTLRSLPSPLDGLGFALELTLADSTTRLAGRPDTPLPFQADYSGNAAVSFEKGGFSGRLALAVSGDRLEELGPGASQDLYVEARAQLDLYARYQLTRRLSVFVEGINLTDEALERSWGPERRPAAVERYGWWGTAGVRVDW